VGSKTRFPSGRALAASTTVAALCLVAPFGAAKPRLEWVQTAKHTYVLMPPTLVTDAAVQSAAWSSDGGYLLVAASRTAPTLENIFHPLTGPMARDPGQAIMLAYDHATRAVRKLWESDTLNDSIEQVVWLEHSTTAYAVIEQRTPVEQGTVITYGLLSVDAASGRFAWVPGMERLAQPPTLIPSPRQAQALAVFDDQPAPEVLLADGSLRSQATAATPVAAAPGAAPPIPDYRPLGAWIFPGANNFWTLREGAAVAHRIRTGPAPLAGIEWGADGSQWYLATMNRKSKAHVFQKLEDDGRLTTVNVVEYAEPAPRKPELLLHNKPMLAKQRKARRGFKNVWLSSPDETWHPDVLVTPSGGRAELAPKERALFFVEGGIAKVRAIEELTEDQKKEMMNAVKAEAITDAKQAALGLLMYGMDMDDVLPGAGSLDVLEPYLGDLSILDNFMYTPPGDLNLTHIGSPAETMIGYIDGPGGRAVAYSDGHVKWLNNP